MNPSSHTTFVPQRQLSVGNSTRNQFEEIGMHDLWRRSSPTDGAHLNPTPKVMWPIQVALDKVERFISKTLFWQFIGRFDRLSAPLLINLNKHLSLSSLGATHFRLQYDMPHLTTHQRKQRVSLVKWLMSDYEFRFAKCLEQWRSLNLYQPLTTSLKSPVRPQWIIDPIAGRYLERLRGWIEDAYDLKKIPLHIPLPHRQSSSAQLSDISVGLKILLTQLKMRSTEMALSKYITRCNWGRWLVKASLLAPVVSLIARKALFIQLPVLTISLAGLAGAVVMWVIGYQLFWNEEGHNTDLCTRLVELATDLTMRERNTRVQEWTNSHGGRQKEASPSSRQDPSPEQSKEATSDSISKEEESRKIEAMKKKLARLQAESEKWRQRKKKILQDLQKERQRNKKELEWLEMKIRSLGIKIDYSQGSLRLILPLRIKGPEQHSIAVGSS